MRRGWEIEGVKMERKGREGGGGGRVGEMEWDH